jgi:hypothetical protein
VRPSDEARETLRAAEVAAIPRWYSPIMHLVFPSLIGLGVIAVTPIWIHHLRWWELLTIPFVFVLSNMVEWRTHRDALHRRAPGFTALYDQHTPIHHRLFLTEDMAMRDRREFRLVLIPAYGILAILMALAPFVGLLLWLGWTNVALLWLATAAGYVVSYEWLHLSYHLPPDSFIGRLRLIRVLRRHHATHHDPTLMQRWNMNVTLPLWDWVRGTIYRPDRGKVTN